MIARNSLFIVIATLTFVSAAVGLDVVSTSPTRHSMTANRNTNITVSFDDPLMVSTIDSDSFRVFGRWSGPATGTFSFSNGNRNVTFNPDSDFMVGDTIMVNLSNDVQAFDGTPYRSAGFAYTFMIKANPAQMVFDEIQTTTNRAPPGSSTTRIYGAAATDLNHDGYPDLTTVNEDSFDIRVFLNSADGSGMFTTPFLDPPLPIGIEASPNEPADFDNDGNADIVAAASSSSSAWIALGNGDGTFDPAQSVSVGSSPHGIAVLDVDGDADMDIVTSNTGGNNLSLMINNGSGVFGAATSFDSGGNGEYALGSADMNSDGIMDLVVGSRNSQDITIMRGNGDGTFTTITTESAGGLAWMIACGDVNGDGNMDVSVANSQSNVGAILLGDGAGGLGTATTTSTANHCVATDLGDLDGDGDLDWVLSSFGGGEWRIFENDGNGSFSFDQVFFATSNPSCAVILDIDNDSDLDLVLTDEIADTIHVHQNRDAIGPPVPTVSEWGVLAMGLLMLTAGTLIWHRRTVQLN